MWNNRKALGLQLLWYYSNGYEGAYPPGGFLSSLLGTWEKADYSNRMRLSIGFPVLAGLIAKYQETGTEEFAAWLETVEEEED